MHGVLSHFEHFFLVKTEFIFSIAFPIWKPYLFLKNTQRKLFLTRKNCWKSLENPCIGFWECWLQWWWLEVCLTKSLWDKVCILLNNGNFAKKKTASFLASPPQPFLPLPFALLRWNLILIQNVLDLPIRKRTISEEIWNIFWLFSSDVVFWIMLQNILKVVLWWAVSKIMHTYSPCLYSLYKVSWLQHDNIMKK